MIASDLERVGDLARNIAKSSRRLANQLEAPVPDILLELARASQDMPRRALNSFSEGDAAGARDVLDLYDAIDAVEDEVVQAELEGISAHPTLASEAVDIILIAKNLERVGDHATNIAEDVIMIAEARNLKHASKLGG
jgi:phosphate transport system protein